MSYPILKPANVNELCAIACVQEGFFGFLLWNETAWPFVRDDAPLYGQLREALKGGGPLIEEVVRLRECLSQIADAEPIAVRPGVVAVEMSADLWEMGLARFRTSIVDKPTVDADLEAQLVVYGVEDDVTDDDSEEE